MKVNTAPAPINFPPTVAHTFSLPQGIIGFHQYTQAELLYLPDNLPFIWMKLHGLTDSVHFLVIEPGGLLPHYAPELFDEDALGLGLADSSEAMVLTIVTLEQQRPLDATVNLVGPVIVNRRTRVGRQLVIANYSHYGTHYPLVQVADLNADQMSHASA
jgi:flagellar assembly factor FliW